MDVRQTLICFFFFTLRGRNTGLINAEIISTGTEGGNITVACIFTFSARKKIFCKQPCEEGDILIETEDVTAQRGRYSITYTEGAYPVRSTVLYVSITKLTKSDAGKYRCGLHRSLPLPSYQDIEIRVEEAPISSKPNVTLKPLSASVPSASTQTTTQLSSSTGSYTPSSASPEGTQQSQKEQTPAAATGVLLYVRLTLVIMIIVLSTAVLIICRKRASEPKEPSVEAVYANITEANRVSEEIREEDEESRTPPLEMSAV
ncbi:CMRF35-like molecule 5 isoform X3 [Anarhichas minor]|uniref:CMRF35-like molecule 5 isoform X3 n=1 Tax=Anarhichas minor TaxID=65739 RepID=UPI003F7323C0